MSPTGNSNPHYIYGIGSLANGRGVPSGSPHVPAVPESHVFGTSMSAPAVPSTSRHAHLAGAPQPLPSVERAGSATSSTAPPSTPPPSSQHNHIFVDQNGHARPVFKNPLGAWKSPSPPLKRQKTGKAPERVSSSFGGTGATGATPYQRSGSDSSSREQPIHWTPRVLSLSQPMPSTTPAAKTAKAAKTPVAKTVVPKTEPVARPASNSSGLSSTRAGKTPNGFTEAVEDNRIVYVLDSDDEDTSVPAPTPAPKLAPKPAPNVPSTPSIATGTTPSPTPGLPGFKLPVQKPTASGPSRRARPPAGNAWQPVQTPRSITQHGEHVPPPSAPSLTIPPPVLPPSSNGGMPHGLPHGLSNGVSITRAVTSPLNVGHGPNLTFVSHPAANANIKASPVEDAGRPIMHSFPSPASLSSRLPTNLLAASLPLPHTSSPAPTVVPPAPAAIRTRPMPVSHATPSTSMAPVTPTTRPVLSYASHVLMASPPAASTHVTSLPGFSLVLHNESQQPTRMINESVQSPIVVDTTPSRKRAKLDQGKPLEKQKASQNNFVRYANLARRPYLCSAHRTFVEQNYASLPNWLGRERPQKQQVIRPTTMPAATAPSAVIHVDFLPKEIQTVLDAVRFVHTKVGISKVPKKAAGKKNPLAEKELKQLLRRQKPEFLQLVVDMVSFSDLAGRGRYDVHAFLTDASKGNINTAGTTKSSSTATIGGPAALTLKRHDRATYTAQEQQVARATKLNTLLLSREVAGQRPVPGRLRQLVNLANASRTLREDGLRLRNEWTNLAGDVTTISWTSENAFLCGTTTHMDDRNHQYNRQGNLALASINNGKMQAYPEHRIARSQVAAEGRTGAYDDPWLYTSVVSSDYDNAHGFAFTSSFDKTVLMWRVAKDGSSMSHQGTWKHDGKVNFVVATSCPFCLVATAADVPVEAVRVYRLPTVQERMRGHRISYKMLSCERLVDLEGKPILTDKWAYFPATVRWGISETTRHLLLVGYSPRGLGVTAEDDDIPEDRRNSGELCLWDGLTGDKWRLLGGTSQNVFEVAWHPTQACFIAATAPTLHSATINEHVRTQIRIFRQSTNANEYGGRAYSEVQTLDCYADDINELALQPNSLMFMYVAAGCTNGRTYVWDSSQGDDPIHALGHGTCIEEQSGETISVEDTGVKFVAWGATPDRLYTGSSDGLVKAWNIRSHGVSGMSPFVRNVLQCTAPVSFGAFSPDKSRLAVGDASGRVFVLSVEDGMEKDVEDEGFISEDEADDTDDGENKDGVNKGMGPTRPGLLRRSHSAFRHHPPELIRHDTPPPPETTRAGLPGTTAASRGNDGDDYSGIERARAFVSSGQLIVHPDPTVGAIKGPNYADTHLYGREFHQDGLPGRPLLAQYDRLQQENRPHAGSSPSRQRPLRSILPDVGPSLSFSSFSTPSTSATPSANMVLGTPDPLQTLQRQNAARRVQALHSKNLARDLDVEDLALETRIALELADRAALLNLDDDPDSYGFVYEELPDE